ncbi:hypothetical protein JTE90_017238 [Oedothorax gibbosus]|uniref:Uncharacterized protein n=1 Tax=Oedothorax gibbosus TaxID=931172 RepID=A0AAV6VE27_9ARAC|nr:hypothetical protein JTE90_017238 [Oedothorax gibbosus]
MYFSTCFRQGRAVIVIRVSYQINMAEISESTLLLEERNNYFPWVAEVNKRFSKCFPSDYDDETLDFLHREIEKELGAISIRSPKKNEALYATLLCFYNHFCWKTKWKKPSRMKSSCARILSSICRVGLMLSKGNVQSKWINQVLSAVSLFPGDCDYLYDALLQIYKFNKKYYSAYAAVLRHILKDPQPKTENPCTFFKLLLLFRRLKFFLQNPYEKAQVDSQAASVAIPENLMSWLADNDLHDVIKAMKKNKMMIMKKKFANVLLVRIREAVLRNTSMKTPPILKDSEAIQFSIDCNPETVNELLSNSLNMEEDTVKSEVDVKITKSKRKSTVEHNESNEGSSTKKRKKKSLGNKLNKKRMSIEQSPKEVILESEISNKFIDSNLDSNTPSNSNKKKNSKAKFNQVPQKEISEMSVKNLKEESKAPLSTDVIEVESDSILIQSYSSAIQSINKIKKKRNTINIVEEFNPKDIENEASSNENDMVHVHSIKKDKKRKTINIVEDIENSSNFNQNYSLNVRSAKKDQKNRTSMNVVEKPQKFENELVVNEKTVSSTKKGQKRKSLNIAQENILNDRASQSESETDVSLYVQSLETGKNRRKTITITLDSGQKYIEKDLLSVSSSKKGKKKRQTINTVEEINRKNIECQSKFNEKYSLCTPPVTTESDSSLIPRSASKTNKKRSHFTSADFIVTCENIDSVDKEYFNDLNKRNSTSLKNEWIVTVNSDSGTIPLTPKTPPEKHNFKVSEMKETIFEAVSVETNDNTKVEAIAEKNNAKNIATPVALTSASESESLDTDEEAKSGETKIIKPIPKVVKFEEEVEYIVSANETQTNNTEDDDDSISETESVDTVGETQSSESTDGTKTTKTNTVKFVDETESITSTNEIEVVNTEDEEAGDSISETESVDTAEEADSSGETKTTIPIAESVKFVDEAENVSANEAEAFELIAKLGDSNILEEARILETTESKEENVEVIESVQKVNEITDVVCTDNTTISKPVVDTDKVEANESIDVGPSDKTKAFKSVPEPIDEKNVEDTQSIDTVSEAVRVIEETKGIDSNIQTEDLESIYETENKTMEDVKTDKDKCTIDIIEETEDINSFNKTENLDNISEKEERSLNKIQTEVTVEEVKLIDIVAETETIDINDETKDFEPIPETEEETMEDVKIVENTDAISTIEETESIDSFNKSQDFESIPETKEILEDTEDIVSTNETDGFESVPETEEAMKGEAIVVDSEAIEIVEETKDIVSTTETDGFESVPETEEETVKGKDIVVDSEAIEIVEETKDIVSTTETEEETVKGKDIVVDSEAIEIVEETKDIVSTTETDVFESVPETEKETVKGKDIVVDSEAIEIVEETEDIFSTNKIEEFKHVPETEEESKKTVEDSEKVFKKPDGFETIPQTEEESVVGIEGSEAIEIVEETKDIDFTNKTDSFECVPETEDETVKDKDIIVDWEAFEIIEETEDIDSTNKIEEFEHVPETEKESIKNVEGSEATEIVDETDALDAVVIKETTCSTLEETTTVSIDEIKTVEDMEVVNVVKDGNTTESIDKIETVDSIFKPEGVDIIQETDVKSLDKTDTLELRKDINTVEFTERDGIDIKTKAVKDVQDTDAKPVRKAKVRDSIEASDKTETEDSDEILEIIDSTDKTETEDTDEYLEIIESTDDKTEETDEQINFESTNKANAENVDKSGGMVYKVEAEDVVESENVPSSTQCSTEISESELDTSITQYNSLVKEIFCDAGSDDSVLRESLSPCKIETIKKHSIESVSSQSVMSPKSSAEILENKPSLTKNCEVSSLNSEIGLNSSENIADESSEIEEAAAINNTQYYCELLLKEVTEDNFIEDSDNETVDESKNIDLELSKIIPNESSSEETALDSRAQFEGHSSTKKDISFSKIVVEAISNDEKVDSKGTETVESIAEGLYKKMLKAKKERLSLTDSVPEKTAAAILTENTVSYVIGKVIEKVEDVNNTDNGESIGDLKKHIKFAPERSQLPKLGNLSNLKPFGFPEEKSECLSFVDFSKRKVNDSTEIESSDSCLQAKRKDFYPYRNLLAIEVPDDKSENNFSDVLVDDKLEETICVLNEEDSSDDDTEIDEKISYSPVRNSTQNEAIVKEPKIDDEIQSSVLKTQNSPKLDSEELISLVCAMKDPVVNLGRKCDDVRFESELSQHDNDVASSYEKNEILSTETKNQIEVEDIVGSQASVSSSQESKGKPEKASENEEIIPTRRLRNRNLSLSEVTNKSASAEENQNSEKSSHTRSRRKPSNLKTSTESNSEATSTNLRRSTRKLRNEFKDLRLDSPKRCNPANEDTSQNIESDSNGKPTKSKKLTTRSTAAKINDSAVSKSESDSSDLSVEVENGESTLPKETSKNLSTRKHATRSTATKITKYFSVQTKAELTPVNETKSEDQIEDSAESSTENLPVKKRFTRSNVFAIDKLKSEPFDAKEDVKDSNLGDGKSKNTVPKRSTRMTTRGASRTKLSQNTPAKEESDVEDKDTQYNVSEESHKENLANEEEAASKEVESSSKEYNLRRSTRNLIRPSRLKLSQDHF